MTGATDVVRLAEALATLNRSTRRALRLPLSASSIAALGTIIDRGPIRLRELADHEGVTPATLSRIVAALEGEGFARRRTDPEDRRSAFLEATDAGRAIMVRVRSDRADALSGRLSRLTPAQARTLAAAVPVLEVLALD